MNILDNIKKGFAIYSKNFFLLFCATLITCAGSMITIGVVSGPLMAGLLAVNLRLLRGGSARTGEVFACFNKFLTTFLLVLLIGTITTAIALLTLLSVTVQFVLAPVITLITLLALGLIIEQNMGCLDAFKQAARRFAADPLRLWLYSFIAGLVSVSGALLAPPLALLTLPMETLLLAMAYRELCENPFVEIMTTD